MSANVTPLKEWTTAYTTGELVMVMSVAMVIALVSIALIFRFIKTMSTVRNYEEACEKVKSIEEKLEEMKNFLAAAQLEYEKDLAELNKVHNQECFEYQQLVFERNSEILELKNKLLKFNMNSPV